MPNARYSLILLGLLVMGLALSHVLGGGPAEVQARWPTDETLFQVDGWSVDAGEVSVGTSTEGTAVLLVRSYRSLETRTPAELVIWSNPQPEARALFRKGPDRDFLGAGYTSEPAPRGLVPPVPGGDALITSQGDEQWLLIYMYGERRGPLGNGPNAWFYGELDALLDQPNTYFLARVAVPYQPSEQPSSSQLATELASTLFARLTNWYETV